MEDSGQTKKTELEMGEFKILRFSLAGRFGDNARGRMETHRHQQAYETREDKRIGKGMDGCGLVIT